MLLVAETCNPNHIGASLNSYLLAEQLANRPNLSVTLVTAAGNEPSLRRSPLGQSSRVVYIDLDSHRSVIYRAWHALATLRSRWNPATLFEVLRYRHFEREARRILAPEILGGQFDLMHRLNPVSPWIPSPLGNWSQLPLVLGPLSSTPACPPAFAKQCVGEYDSWPRLTAGGRWFSGLRTTYRRAAAVICGNQYTAKSIPSSFRGRLFRISDCNADSRLLDDPRVWQPPRDRRFRFITVGSLWRSKGHWLTLAAWKDSHVLRDAELTIIGDGPEKRSIANAIRQLALTDQVQLIGFLDRGNVAHQLSQAQAFVAPSLLETETGPLLDAMASGLPSIVVKNGAPGEIVNEQCGIALPLTEEEELVANLRAAMEGLVQEPRRCHEYSQNAKRHVRQYYRWSAQAAKIAQVYRQVLEPDLGPTSADKQLDSAAVGV